jgi:glycosyltransferase involved in cell wall biosynthesis
MESARPSKLSTFFVHHARNAWGLLSTPGLYGADRRRVAEFLRGHGVRTVLAEYGVTGVKMIGACRDAAIPLYVHFHGYDATSKGRQWHWRRRYRQLFSAATGVIAPSRFLADKLRALGCAEAKLHVSPNGVNPCHFTPAHPEEGRVVAVGRLVEKKAPQRTIEVFAKVKEIVPHAHLDIVGDGELRPTCQALIGELGLEQAVTMHGAQPPNVVAGLMGRAAVFAQHSVTGASGDMESFGVSLIEAQACALPVVATRHNGFPETIADGDTGILVEEHDVDSMAAAMITLLQNPERAAAMGRAGRARVLAQFTHDHVRRRLLAIMGLQDLLTDTPPDGDAGI